MFRREVGMSRNERFAFGYGLLVEGDEVVVTLGECLAEAFDNGFVGHEGTGLEECAEQEHVVSLGVAHLDSSLGGRDGDDADVGAGGLVVNAVGVVDECAAGFHLRLEFVERLLVEDDGCVILVDDG